jgi:hypothetical protein
MTLLKILHAVSGVLAVFHMACAFMLTEVWQHSRPSHPDPASGATVRWETTDYSGSFRTTHVFYIRPYDDAVWNAAIVVAVVCVLICGALTLVLKMDARRNGRTTLY